MPDSDPLVSPALSPLQWLIIHAFLTKKVDCVSLVHHVWTFCSLLQDCVFQEKPGILYLILKNKQYPGAVTSMLSLCETQTIQMIRTFKRQTEGTNNCNTKKHKPAYCSTGTNTDNVRVLILIRCSAHNVFQERCSGWRL